MMHACASGAKLRGGGSILGRGAKAMYSIGSLPPRMSLADRSGCQTVNGVGVAEAARSSASRAQLDALRHLAGGHQPPQGDEQLTRQRHDHGFARGLAAIGGALAEPADEPAVLLEDQKAPGQLDHAAADPAVAGAGQSLLAPALAALVRCAGQSGIARHSSAIA